VADLLGIGRHALKAHQHDEGGKTLIYGGLLLDFNGHWPKGSNI